MQKWDELCSVGGKIHLLLLALLCLGPSGCGMKGQQEMETLQPGNALTEVPAFPELPWPPAETAGEARSVSDDEVTFLGAEYTSTGGDSTVDEDSVILRGRDPLSFALYSCEGFSNFIVFSQLEMHYTLGFAAPEDELALYYGLANYEKGRWDWFKATPGSFSTPVPSPQQYASPSGIAHVALVSWGDGSSRVNRVTFVRAGLTSTDTPQNLRAEALVGEIHLEWDPVVPCQGYNVYRATNPQFSDAVKLNQALVPLTTYVNEATTHRIWYYRVSAVNAVESGLSNMVDLFSPRNDVLTPPNLRVTGETLTSVTLAWDWQGEDPAQWKVYFKGEKDFNLEQPVGLKNMPPFARQTTLTDLVPGETMHFRVVTVDSSGDMGRMTDDVEATTRSLYEWGDVEIIGEGMHPLDVVVAEGDLTATYHKPKVIQLPSPFPGNPLFDAFGGDVMVARRELGEWSVENLSEDLRDINIPLAGSWELIFYDAVDIEYSSGSYIVGSHSKLDFDAWVFSGSPGDGWTAFRIEGDGSEWHVPALVEGRRVRVAANATEFSVVYFNFTDRELILQQRGIAEDDSAWSRTVLRDENLDFIDNYHSIAHNPQGELSIMTMDLNDGKLLVGHEADDYSFVSILSPETPYIGAFNDMQYIDGNYFASAFDGPEHRLVLINDGSQPWQTEPVSYREIEAGNHSRLSSFGGYPMVLYYGTPPEEYLGNEQRWYFGLYENGNWHTEWIQIEDYDFYDFGPEAEIVELDGQLYFIFEDLSDGMIKAAKAEPPVL